ncbi:MAG: MerR family transcriptional regulator [Flavobacteriales bacterium]|nr:MerR family transcriptional regulator [Flavobacteriales bacterium]
MPLKEKTIERIYWTIGEVADQLGVNTSLLRYWEKEFGMLRPKRTGKGDRLYTKEDIAKVKDIQHLLKDQGYTIQGAKDRLRVKVSMDDRHQEIQERLLAVREALIQLRAELVAEDPVREHSLL